MRPQGERERAATAFAVANQLRLAAPSPEVVEVHDAAWRGLLEACGGDRAAADAAAFAALRVRRSP